MELVIYLNLQGRDPSEDLGVDGTIILERILGKWSWVAAGCMHVAQDRDQWMSVVNT
jgi:hypothetical protein